MVYRSMGILLFLGVTGTLFPLKGSMHQTEAEMKKKLFVNLFQQVAHHLGSSVLQAVRKECGDTDTEADAHSPCDWSDKRVDDGQVDHQLGKREDDNDEVEEYPQSRENDAKELDILRLAPCLD